MVGKILRFWVFLCVIVLIGCSFANAESIFSQLRLPAPSPTPTEKPTETINPDFFSSSLLSLLITATPSPTPLPSPTPSPLLIFSGASYTDVKRITPNAISQKNGNVEAIYRHTEEDDFSSYISYLSGAGYTVKQQAYEGNDNAFLISNLKIAFYAIYDLENQTLTLLYSPAIQPTPTPTPIPTPKPTPAPTKTPDPDNSDNGAKVCPHCNRGYCWRCGGSGYQNCFGCGGRRTCPTCNGKRRDYIASYTGDGGSYVDCAGCHGSGQCWMCNGSGKEKCPYCDNGKCSYCHGDYRNYY